MTRFCPACGAARAGDAAFCASCGKPFADATAAAAPAAPSAAPSAAPASAPPPAPTYQAPPAPGYAPAMGYAQPHQSARPAWQRWVIIGIGIVAIVGGVAKMGDALGWFDDRPSGSSAAPVPYSASESISEQWLAGYWYPSDGATCANWMRFYSGMSWRDQNGLSGTWSLSNISGINATLTLTEGTRPPRSSQATRLGTDSFMVAGTTWRRGNCTGG